MPIQIAATVTFTVDSPVDVPLRAEGTVTFSGTPAFCVYDENTHGAGCWYKLSVSSNGSFSHVAGLSCNGTWTAPPWDESDDNEALVELFDSGQMDVQFRTADLVATRSSCSQTLDGTHSSPFQVLINSGTVDPNSFRRGDTAINANVTKYPGFNGNNDTNESVNYSFTYSPTCSPSQDAGASTSVDAGAADAGTPDGGMPDAGLPSDPSTLPASEGTTLFFDGKVLYILNEQGGITGALPATSGRDGSTDTGAREIGPIPEGKYLLDTGEISEGGVLRNILGDWGSFRAPLHPFGDTKGRSGFFLHGGIKPGSAGCIDVGTNDVELFRRLLRKGGSVIMEVKY